MQPVPFELFGTAHNVVMVLNVVLAVGLVRLVRHFDSERVTRTVCVGFALILLVNQIMNWVYRFVVDGRELFIQEHLPLHVCGMSAILSVVVLLNRNRLAYELVYFWGLAGATNAVVTPALDAGWPEYHFIQYYISHGGIVVTAVLMTWGLGMRPTFRSLLRAFFVLNVLVAVMTGFNLLTGANYMYLSEQPVTDSPFLFFEWPWYILWLEVLALVFFALCYLPVHLEQRLGGRVPGPEAAAEAAAN
ncbi:MAG: TIGR02206 family membrane protein [Gemmatimonadetes bacterium]|nr:TIGR02206 family membrane protein [Gemmatimonadota bacterium]MYG37207.1 TIGR02206 family membrane protein [Gemmatimonadota bacterium]